MDKPKRIRRSYKALNVANELIRKIEQKKPINLKQIAVSQGYSMKSAIAQKPYQTDTFRDAITPVIDKMRVIHNKALDNLVQRNFKKERMDSVINAAKQMVHDTQLLQGKSTENIATQVVMYGSDDFLATQIKTDVK